MEMAKNKILRSKSICSTKVAQSLKGQRLRKHCYVGATNRLAKEYSMEDLVNAFEGCAKTGMARDNLKNNVDAGQNAFEKPDRTLSFTKPTTMLSEIFRCNTQARQLTGYSSRPDVDFLRTKWDKNLCTVHAKILTLLGSSRNHKNGMSLVFLGNKKGKSTDSAGERYITTKPVDVSKGGVISFYLKDGPDDGDKGCKATMEEFNERSSTNSTSRKTKLVLKAGVRTSHHATGMEKACIVPTVTRKDDGCLERDLQRMNLLVTTRT